MMPGKFRHTDNPDLRNSYVLEDPAQVGIEYAYDQLCTYIRKVQLKSEVQHTGT